MNTRPTVSDSALAALLQSADPAVSAHSSEDAIRLLIDQFLIERKWRYDVLDAKDRTQVAASVARDVLGVYNSLLNDDLRGLVMHGGALAAKLEVSQSSWHEHHGQIADSAQLLLDINRALPSYSFLIRPVRRALIEGGFRVSNHVDVATGATITPRLTILEHITSTGLKRRILDVYRPYQPQRLL